jgi:putative membrane protein
MTEPADRFKRRFPRSVYGVGSEPDARFTLANERTFLAWIRTSLALIAAGVALEAFALPIAPGFRLGASLLLIGLGILAPLQAWIGWMSVERALRLERPLSPPGLAGPIGIGVALAGVLLGVGLLLP